MTSHFRREKIWRLPVVLLLTSLILVTSGCGGSAETASKKDGVVADKPSLKAVSFGTSSVGSSFYTISVGMGDLLTKKTGINMSVEPVGGSDANVRALADKKIEMGMLNASAAANALKGTGAFATSGKVPVRILAQGQDSIYSVVVRNDSGIKTIADLKGKKFIARRKSLVDIELTAKALLKAYNMTVDDVKMIETAETSQAIEALKIGTADAAIIPGGVPSSNLTDLAQSTAISLVSIPDEKLNMALKDLGQAFHRSVIPASTYKGMQQDVAFAANSAELVVLDSFPEDAAYKITKTLMESQQELKALHNEGKSWSKENALKNPPVPLHPGSIKYFKEIGAWTSKEDTLQQELLR